MRQELTVLSQSACKGGTAGTPVSQYGRLRTLESVLERGRERFPVRWGEDQRRTARVLAITYRDDARQIARYLHVS
jgi:hypothetical protein